MVLLNFFTICSIWFLLIGYCHTEDINNYTLKGNVKDVANVKSIHLKKDLKSDIKSNLPPALLSIDTSRLSQANIGKSISAAPLKLMSSIFQNKSSHSTTTNDNPKSYQKAQSKIINKYSNLLKKPETIAAELDVIVDKNDEGNYFDSEEEDEEIENIKYYEDDKQINKTVNKMTPVNANEQNNNKYENQSKCKTKNKNNETKFSIQNVNKSTDVQENKPNIQKNDTTVLTKLNEDVVNDISVNFNYTHKTPCIMEHNKNARRIKIDNQTTKKQVTNNGGEEEIDPKVIYKRNKCEESIEMPLRYYTQNKNRPCNYYTQHIKVGLYGKSCEPQTSVQNVDDCFGNKHDSNDIELSQHLCQPTKYTHYLSAFRIPQGIGNKNIKYWSKTDMCVNKDSILASNNVNRNCFQKSYQEKSLINSYGSYANQNYINSYYLPSWTYAY